MFESLAASAFCSLLFSYVQMALGKKTWVLLYVIVIVMLMQVWLVSLLARLSHIYFASPLLFRT